MENSLLETILERYGLRADFTLIFAAAIIVLLVLVIVLLVVTVKQKRRCQDLESRYNAFMRGKNAVSLEGRLVSAARDIRRIDQTLESQRERMDLLDKRLAAAYRKTSVVRYNSSAGMGGIMSFVLVMLDETNDGFIMNVIHAADGSYPYIKRVLNGEAEMDLSREEARALEMALMQD